MHAPRDHSTILVSIWGTITIIGIIIVIRSLRSAQYEMAYISALFAINDGASVLSQTSPLLSLPHCASIF